MTALNDKQKKFLATLRTPWKMRLYFWRKLPSVAFWKARIHSISEEGCTIALPYTWRSQNPFRSIYFSAQAGAAELSSGLIASLALQGRPPVSMLVTDFRISFLKKATAESYFECKEGREIFEAIERAIQTAEPQVFTAHSTARMADGTVVSRAEITWSFKRK